MSSLAPQSQTQPPPLPSVKDLASSEAPVRRKCLTEIIHYLEEGRPPAYPITQTESLQLWRGLYVALYMHDSKNALSVQTLIAQLAGTLNIMDSMDQTLLSTSTEAADSVWLQNWSSAFWETVCREWATIDQWRMNKVLLLVRFFLRETFRLAFIRASDTDWSQSDAKAQLSRQIQVLEAWPLSPRERKVPDGLRLHVLDVWADELFDQLDAMKKADEDTDRTGRTEDKALSEIAEAFMEPVRRISKEALGKGVRMRAKDAIQLAEERLS